MANKSTTLLRATLRNEAVSSAPAPPATRKSRSRGRPKSADAENVREKLLVAARELFFRYGYRAVSSRQIGAAAGVNFAMIRYYFGGKPGLYREILDQVIGPALDGLLSAGAPIPISLLLSKMARTWAANPWMAGFILREVLTPDGPMRDMFLGEFLNNRIPLAQRLIQAAIDRGEVRSDLDPKLLLLSMVSLAIFPYLGYAVTSRAFGVRYDEESVERLLRHTTTLLLQGVTTAP